MKRLLISLLALLAAVLVAFVGGWLYFRLQAQPLDNPWNAPENPPTPPETVDPGYMKPTKMIVLDCRDGDTPAEGFTLTVTDYDPFTPSLTVTIANHSGEEKYYGYGFTLQKQQGDTYVEVQPREPMCWIELAVALQDGEEAEETLSLSGYDALEEGAYRLQMGTLTADFGLHAEWTE